MSEDGFSEPLEGQAVADDRCLCDSAAWKSSGKSNGSCCFCSCFCSCLCYFCWYPTRLPAPAAAGRVLVTTGVAGGFSVRQVGHTLKTLRRHRTFLLSFRFSSIDRTSASTLSRYNFKRSFMWFSIPSRLPTTPSDSLHAASHPQFRSPRLPPAVNGQCSPLQF